jgi:hypothetical protein
MIRTLDLRPRTLPLGHGTHIGVKCLRHPYQGSVRRIHEADRPTTKGGGHTRHTRLPVPNLAGDAESHGPISTSRRDAAIYLGGWMIPVTVEDS